MCDDEQLTENGGENSRSRPGPNGAGWVPQIAVSFKALVNVGTATASRLFPKDGSFRRELLALELDALTFGVNEEHFQRLLALWSRMAEEIGGLEKLAVRGRGRPTKPKPAKLLKPIANRDQKILEDLSLELAKEPSLPREKSDLPSRAKDDPLRKAYARARR